MPSLREQVRARAKNRCEYCQLSQEHTVLPHEMDHIRAQKHVGETILENLCWSCTYCNAAKGPNIAGYDPMSGLLTGLFDPERKTGMSISSGMEPSLLGRLRLAV